MCDRLNQSKYRLNDSTEKWNVYDYDYSQESYTEKRLFFSGGALKAKSL